jgi:PAS domain S-box-containing protein
MPTDTPLTDTPLTVEWLVQLSLGSSRPDSSLPFLNEVARGDSGHDAHSLLEALPDAVLIAGLDCIVQGVNRQTEAMLGYSREELIGQPLTELISHGDPYTLTLKKEGVPALPQTSPWLPSVILSGLRKNGTKFPVEVFPTVLRTKSDVFLIVVVRDAAEYQSMSKEIEIRASELKRAEGSFRRQYEERAKAEADLRLQQKLESIGQLAAGIAHEINTPMQYIGDSVHFLRQSFDDLLVLLDLREELCQRLGAEPGLEVMEVEERSHFEYLRERTPRAFARTVEGIERVTSIVRAMKEFAHPYGDEKSPTDLNKALGYALMVARNEYKYVAEVQTDFGEISLVPCRPGEMNQVFLNLIVNAGHAIAASGQNGFIRIRTREEENAVVIQIEDTGTGIPKEIRDRVFEPFFTTKPVGKGTGQGLAIAHSIITKHGGALTFRSEVGRGTTFVIQLPIDQSRAQSGAR